MNPAAQQPETDVVPKCDATNTGRHWALRCTLAAGHDGKHSMINPLNGGWMGSWTDE